jgi:DNA-binding LacI/PurR family transcriptional regulator
MSTRIKNKRKVAAKTSMRDIAMLSGTSMATVSRTLSGSPQVTDETREAVLKIAAQHGYVVNRNARKLRQRRSNTVAVVADFKSMPGGRLSEPFHFQLLADLVSALGRREQDLLLCSPGVERQHAYQMMLAAKGADGIIFFGHGGRDAAFRELARVGAPFVVWGAPKPGLPYCCIGSDNAGGGSLAARRFLELRRRQPLFVGLGDEHLEMRQRWEGFRKELRTAAAPRRIVLPDLSFESAVQHVEAWLRQATDTPDAIFAASDTIALATLAVLRRLGLDVPKAVSVIGFDDVAEASYSTPALSSIRQDTARASALMVEALLAAIDGQKAKPVRIPVQLVLRET